MKRYIMLSLLLLAALACKEEKAPVIDDVWINMEAFPIGSVQCAYPEQTLCLYGSGFTGVRYLEVNGTYVDISATVVLDTDRNITFALPEDVNVSDSPENMYIKVVTEVGEYEYSPFLVKSSASKPEITKLSSTATLVPGQELVITGKNLDGAKEVYLPVCYGQKVLCPFSQSSVNTSATLYVVIPEADFATGQLEVVMEKTDLACEFTYTERVYSSVYDFIN